MGQWGNGPRLRVSVSDARGRPMQAGGLGAWLSRAAPADARGTVALALVGDRTMRRLNARFRGVDKATDVLSFPEEAVGRGLRAAGLKPPPAARPLPPLGDIAIATGVARRQARQHRHSLQTELRILALHGLLHLLGYDHDSDRGEMRRIEERLRRRAGLPSGLIGRAPRTAAAGGAGGR